MGLTLKRASLITQILSGLVGFITGVIVQVVLPNEVLLAVMFIAIGLATLAGVGVLVLPDEEPRLGHQQRLS